MFSLVPQILATTIATTGLIVYFTPSVRHNISKLFKYNMPNTLAVYNTTSYDPYMIFTKGVFGIIIIGGFLYMLKKSAQPDIKYVFVTDPLEMEYFFELNKNGHFNDRIINNS